MKKSKPKNNIFKDQNNSEYSAGPDINSLYYNDIKTTTTLCTNYINKSKETGNNGGNIIQVPDQELIREHSINSNLKLVIPIARRYTGLGLSLQELISAGNLGLCYAYDKYDASRSTLKDTLLELIDGIYQRSEGRAPEEYLNSVPSEELKYKLFRIISYGKIKDKIQSGIFDNSNICSPNNDYHIDYTEVRNWISKNIKNAKFSSVCGIWIRAFILEEINTFSRLVRKPKLEINKDKKEKGTYETEKLLSIHSPVYGSESEINNPDMFDNSSNSGDYTDRSEILLINTLDTNEDEFTVADALTNKQDNIIEYNRIIKLLYYGIPVTTQRIINDRFGIGLPRALKIKELSDKYGMSQGAVQKHLSVGIESMKQNAKMYDINSAEVFKLVSE